MILEKVVENVVVQQLQEMLEEVETLELFQLKFRSGDGPEMALIATVNNMWQEQDGSGASIFALLDFLAGFDNINSGILLDWL